MTTELAVRDADVPTVSGFEMKPRNLDEAMKFCEIMANSDLVPKDYRNKPGNIMVAIQMGQELGMTPMRSLRSIAVINGRASQWGDDMLAMVLASPVCEYVHEEESTEECGVCEVKRRGDPKPHRQTFSLADAKRAGLLGKQGSWQTNTPRMLKLRARGFALRDKFADILAGLITAEEAMDLPTDAPRAEVVSTQPVTLKDKLRKHVEETRQEDKGLDETMGAQAPADITPLPESQDAPAPCDDPAEPYRAKIRTAHDSKAVNAIWTAIPEDLKQDCYPCYSDRLKELKGK